MKPKKRLRLLITAAAIIHLTASSTSAAPYYWDSNDTTAGFGNTTGTWGTDAFWSTSSAGTAATANTTITDADTVNFGTSTLNYDNGTIGIAAPVTATSIVFGAGQSTDLTIGTAGGSAITLDGATRTIVANSSDHTIAAPISITGDSTVSLNVAGATGAPPRTLAFGVIGGTGDFVFQNTAGGNPNPALFILNGESTYSGTTLLTSTNANANVAMQLGITNALPTTTVLTLAGGAGAGSGRATNLDLNGKNQTLAGLASATASNRTHNILNNSATLSTLTVNDAGNRTLTARIGNGGTNIEIVKQGSGVWTLSGNNTYEGQTTVEAGTITVSNANALGTTAGNTVVSSDARVFTGITGISIAEAFNITGAGIGGANGAIHIGGNATGVAFTGAISLSGDATIRGEGSTGTTFSGGIDTGANILTFDGGGTTTVSTNGITGTGGSVVKNTGGILNMGVANDYSGLTTVNGGALRVQHANALGTTAAGTVVNATSSARVELDGGVTVTGEAITINGAGNFLGALSAASGDNVWAGDVTIGSAGTRLGASTGASLEVSGVIDSGAVDTGLIIRTTDLTGSVILSGENTYLGNTQVLIGKLQLAAGDNRLPVGTNLSFNSGGTNPDAEFDLNGRNQEVAGLTLGGAGVASKNSVNNADVVNLSTLTVNTAAASNYGGILKGNLGLTKEGVETLSLGGANTYTGDTLVSEGVLSVDGTHTGGGDYNVLSAGKLQGPGSTASAINVSGVLSPGASVETFASGTLSMLDGSTFEAEMDSSVPNISGADLQIVSGDLNLNGAIALTLGDLAAAPAAFSLGTTFSLINYSGLWNNGLFTFGGDEIVDGGEFDAGLNRWQLDYAAAEGGLNFTGEYLGGTDSFVNITAVIPEPSTALLGALGTLFLLRRRRS